MYRKKKYCMKGHPCTCGAGMLDMSHFWLIENSNRTLRGWSRGGDWVASHPPCTLLALFSCLYSNSVIQHAPKPLYTRVVCTLIMPTPTTVATPLIIILDQPLTLFVHSSYLCGYNMWYEWAWSGSCDSNRSYCDDLREVWCLCLFLQAATKACATVCSSVEFWKATIALMPTSFPNLKSVVSEN